MSTNRTDEQPWGTEGHRQQLTRDQDLIVEAIEKSDKFTFEKLGGSTGFDLNYEITTEGIFPLLVASAKGDKEMVQLMLKNEDIDINKTDRYGVNAFWIAAFYGNTQVMKLLIGKGVDLMCKNQNGSNALHIAVKNGSIQVVQELLDIHYPLDYTKSNGVGALGIAAFKGDMKLLDMLYKAGADINLINKHGVSALYLAIKGRHLDCVQYLLERKALVHFNDIHHSQFSPLFFAIKQGDIKIIELLCDQDIDLDECKNHQGYGPLQYAAQLKLDEIANYLSLRMNYPNDEDPEGYTPFTRYLIDENIEMCQKLLARAGPEILEYCNRDGKTPLTLAIIHHKPQSVNWLLIKGVNQHIEDLSGQDSCDYAKQHKQFILQPAFNNCREGLRKRPIIGLRKYISQPQTENSIRQNKLQLLEGKTLTKNPIDPVQVVALRDISLPEIDQFLETQNSQMTKMQTITQILDQSKSPYYQQLGIELHNHNQGFKKKEMDQYQLNAGSMASFDQYALNSEQSRPQISYSHAQLKDKVEDMHHARQLRNSQLKLQRSLEKDQQAHQKKALQDDLRLSIGITVNHAELLQRDSFWNNMKLQQDLAYDLKVKDVHSHLQKVRQPSPLPKKHSQRHKSQAKLEQSIDNDNDDEDDFTNPFDSDPFSGKNKAFKHPRTLGLRLDQKNNSSNRKNKRICEMKHYGLDAEDAAASSDPSHVQYKKVNGKQWTTNKVIKEGNWVEQIGNQAAMNLHKLRQEIENELRKSKAQQFFENSQVQDELLELQRKEDILKKEKQRLLAIKQQKSRNAFQSVQPGFREQHSQTVKKEKTRKLDANDDYREDVYGKTIKQERKQMQQLEGNNQYSKSMLMDDHQAYNLPNPSKVQLPSIFDKRNSLEPTTTASTHLLQFASAHHLQQPSSKRLGKYPKVDLRIYESVIRDPFTLRTREIALKNYHHNNKNDEKSSYQLYLLNPSLRGGNGQDLQGIDEQKYAFASEENDKRLEIRRQRELQEREIKYKEQQKELFDILQAKLSEIDAQVESGIMPKHKHHHHQQLNKTLDYDSPVPSRLRLHQSMKNLTKIQQYQQQQHQTSKHMQHHHTHMKPLVGPMYDGKIMKTDIRAQNRARQCCSQSHSPDTECRGHHSQLEKEKIQQQRIRRGQVRHHLPFKVQRICFKHRFKYNISNPL